jgi:hypothetical protein
MIIFHGILALGDLGWRVEPRIQGSDPCDGEGRRDEVPMSTGSH